MYESKALKGKVSSYNPDGLTCIDISHKKIHEGRAFSFLCEKEGLATEGVCWMYFLTNSQKEVHLRPSMLFSTDSLVRAELWKNVTYTPDTGTTAEVFNHNQRSDITTDVLVKSDATIAGGTRLPLTIFAGAEGSQQAKSGGLGGAEDEWILKADTAYAIKVTNIGSSATDVTITPFWYEVDYS